MSFLISYKETIILLIDEISLDEIRWFFKSDSLLFYNNRANNLNRIGQNLDYGDENRDEYINSDCISILAYQSVTL